KFDNLEDGIPLDQLFRATRAPITKKFFEARKPVRYLGYAAAGTAAAGALVATGYYGAKYGRPLFFGSTPASGNYSPIPQTVPESNYSPMQGS
ncbi:hypothetical protein ACWTQY_33440, partial [Klebsiella pneumoniae]